MRHIGLILVVLLVLAATNVARGEEVLVKEEFVITGYEVGEFAVKPLQENQLKKLTEEVEQKKLQFSTGQLHIILVGSADSSGISAKNDELSGKRADGVKAYLSYHFPDAKINALPRGDVENTRQVRVEWKIISTPTPVPTEKSAPTEDRTISWAAGALAIGAVITLIFIVLSLLKRMACKMEKVRNLTEPEPEQWIKDLDVKGERYSVKVEVKNGVWYSPFTSKSGAQICRDSRKGIIKSLKGCLKKDEFNQQKIELIRKGVINVAGER